MNFNFKVLALLKKHVIYEKINKFWRENVQMPQRFLNSIGHSNTPFPRHLAQGYRDRTSDKKLFKAYSTTA